MGQVSRPFQNSAGRRLSAERARQHARASLRAGEPHVEPIAIVGRAGDRQGSITQISP